MAALNGESLAAAVSNGEALGVGSFVVGGENDSSKFRPTPQKTQDPDKAILLAGLRNARAKLLASVAEIEAIGVSLSRDAINVDGALEWLDSIGAMVLFDVRTPEARCSQ